MRRIPMAANFAQLQSVYFLIYFNSNLELITLSAPMIDFIVFALVVGFD